MAAAALLVVLVFGGAAPLRAEAAPAAGPGGVRLTPPAEIVENLTSDRAIDAARILPWPVGAVLLGGALIPLLWGWKLLESFFATFVAVVCAMIGFAFGTAPWGPAWGAAIAVMAGALGLFVGKWLWKLNRALLGAGMCGLLAAVPGALSGWPVVAAAMAAAGFVAGLWLGWKYSRYVDAVDSSLLGAAMAAFGALVLARDVDRSLLPLTAAGTYVAACALGIAYQFRTLSEHIRWERRHDHLMKK